MTTKRQFSDGSVLIRGTDNNKSRAGWNPVAGRPERIEELKRRFPAVLSAQKDIELARP